MRNYRKVTTPLLLTAALLMGSLALAADTAKKPSGTVTIDETQFGFKGKEHDFKIGGLSVGANIGVSKMAAVGEVYELKEVSKFPGTYTKLDASVALGGGVGGLQMQNENGVIMRLESRTQGLQFNLGMSGVTVTMEK